MNIWDKEEIFEIKSPCTNTCFVSSITGYCEGCLRTIKEISEWDESSNEFKHLVLEKIEQRRKKKLRIEG